MRFVLIGVIGIKTTETDLSKKGNLLKLCREHIEQKAKEAFWKALETR